MSQEMTTQVQRKVKFLLHRLRETEKIKKSLNDSETRQSKIPCLVFLMLSEDKKQTGENSVSRVVCFFTPCDYEEGENVAVIPSRCACVGK